MNLLAFSNPHYQLFDHGLLLPKGRAVLVGRNLALSREDYDALLAAAGNHEELSRIAASINVIQIPEFSIASFDDGVNPLSILSPSRYS